MAVRAHPKLLHKPLAGGRENATVTVEPVLAGEILSPPGFIESKPGRLAKARAYGIGVPKSKWIWLPIPFFIVRHPGAGLILIDTGFHPAVASDPRENLGKLAGGFIKSRVGHDQTTPTALRARGIDPKEIRVVILTHLHWDHVSAVSEFPQATFVLTDEEWQAAVTDKRPWLHGYRPAQFDFAFDYRAIDYDRGGIASYATFGRSFDLFGDGAVRLCSTPGHSPGHQSVVLRLGQRPLLVAGDAIYLMRHLDGADEPVAPADRHRWRRSVQELRLFREQNPDAIVIPGHDTDLWPTLAARYE